MRRDSGSAAENLRFDSGIGGIPQRETPKHERPDLHLVPPLEESNEDEQQTNRLRENQKEALTKKVEELNTRIEQLSNSGILSVGAKKSLEEARSKLASYAIQGQLDTGLAYSRDMSDMLDIYDEEKLAETQKQEATTARTGEFVQTGSMPLRGEAKRQELPSIQKETSAFKENELNSLLVKSTSEIQQYIKNQYDLDIDSKGTLVGEDPKKLLSLGGEGNTTADEEDANMDMWGEEDPAILEQAKQAQAKRDAERNTQTEKKKVLTELLRELQTRAKQTKPSFFATIGKLFRGK